MDTTLINLGNVAGTSTIYFFERNKYIITFLRLNLEVSNKYVSASICHFKNGEVIKASTNEWCIRKFLYKSKDTSAYINLGSVS